MSASPRPLSPVIPWSAVALAVGINVLWGGNGPAIKIGLSAVPPLWSGFFRFTLGATCITAWGLLNGVALRPRRAEWPGLLVLGAVFTLQIALMNVGTRFTTGSLSAVILATNPLFTAAYSHVLLPSERLSLRRLSGMLLAFAGICVVFLQGGAGAVGQGSLLGNAICLASASLLGARQLIAARLLQRIEPSRVVLWQMLVALPCFALGGWLTESLDWHQVGWYPLAGIAYQGIVVAGFNFMAQAVLLRRYPASIITSFNFVSPVSGVLIGVALLADALTWNLAVGVLAVGGGLYLITRRANLAPPGKTAP